MHLLVTETAGNARGPLSRVLLGLAALVAASSLAAHGALAQSGAKSGTGRVIGTVSLGPSVGPRKLAPQFYSNYGPGAARGAAADTNELANVVIYIELAAGTHFDTARAAAPRPMLQHNETFAPHTLAVLRGSTVPFVNDDPFFHNVFSLSRARTFDLGRYPKGSSKNVTFDKAGVVQVFCHIHAGMSAAVLVLDNPFFTAPDGAGHFEIGNLPPGTHRIVAWHERTGPVSQPLVVRAGEATVVDFRLPNTVASSGR
jgi:plastocyanin